MKIFKACTADFTYIDCILYLSNKTAQTYQNLIEKSSNLKKSMSFTAFKLESDMIREVKISD